METAAALQNSSAPWGGRNPNVRIVSAYRESLASDADAIARYVGIELLPWQLCAMRDFLATDREGKWTHKRNGLSVPRQNGKSYLVIAMCLYFVLVKHAKVAFTAQNYSTVLDIFDRFKRIFGTRQNDPNAPYPELNEMVLRVRGTASREGIELKHVVDESGNEYDPCISFSTRTDSSLRGQSYDVLVIDECQLCTSSQFSSINPVTKSGPLGNSMTLYLGTPETPTGRGEIFGNIRKDALSGNAEQLCWLEWSVDEVGDVRDRERWYATNPSLGILGDESEMAAAAGSMNEFDFAQEYLGYWTKQAANAVINANNWRACATQSPPIDGLLAYAVKFTPDGSTGTLSVCLRPYDGHPHVEVIESRSMSRGLAWFADWLESRADGAAAIVIDGMSNAQPLVDELLRRGVSKRAIVKPKSADVSAACSMLLNAVNEGKLTHYDQEQLNDAASTCSRRAIGGSGGWGFDGSGSPLIESCALALWGAMNTKRKPGRKARIA